MPLIALVLALLHHRVKEGRVVFDFDVNLAVNQREAKMDDLQLFAAGSIMSIIWYLRCMARWPNSLSILLRLLRISRAFHPCL